MYTRVTCVLTIAAFTHTTSSHSLPQAIGDSLWETVAFVQQSPNAAWAAADPRFKCSAPPCAFMHRSGFENEEAVVKHDGEFTSEALIAFINTNKLRTYGRLTQENRAMVPTPNSTTKFPFKFNTHRSKPSSKPKKSTKSSSASTTATPHSWPLLLLPLQQSKLQV